jgi:hypothetical protein
MVKKKKQLPEEVSIKNYRNDLMNRLKDCGGVPVNVWPIDIVQNINTALHLPIDDNMNWRLTTARRDHEPTETWMIELITPGGKIVKYTCFAPYGICEARLTWVNAK